MPQMIRIIETTLTDRSRVYGVHIEATDTEPAIELDCVDYDTAHRLANALEAALISAQFDGWSPIERRA